MISRRATYVTAIFSTAVTCFTLGAVQTRRAEEAVRVSYDARLAELRDELQRALGRDKALQTIAVGTAGSIDLSNAADRDKLVAEIKEQLRHEMGLLPVQLMRERQASFVELYSYDNHGQRSYGTAGYLGQGYFITVKHAVVALDDDGESDRKINSIKVVYKGKEITAQLVDSGKAKMEVDPGDWAIIRTRDLDLPALRVDMAFAYEFADPIFRMGNDYSKGVVVSTGYVGQRTAAGLVTSLTDGHPGVSGGGVLDMRGALVGIPIGRMQGDYRFSFILPMRVEMFKKVPGVLSTEPMRPAAPVAPPPAVAAVTVVTGGQ